MPSPPTEMITTPKRRIWGTFLGLVIATVIISTVPFLIWADKWQKTGMAERTACVGRLVRLRLAKSGCRDDLGLAEGDTIPPEVLSKAWRAERCPSGGAYIAGKIGE